MLVLTRVRVEPIEEKMVESRLSWFGHMFGNIVRRGQQLEGNPLLSRRGRPRQTKGKRRTRAVETADWLLLKNNQNTAMVENKHKEPVLCEQNTQHRLIIPNIEHFTKNSPFLN